MPDSWLIFNAPRPLLGHQEWQGDFRHGVFYAAINPEDTGSYRMIKYNCEMDGWFCEFWSKSQAIEKIKDVYYKLYPTKKANVDQMPEKGLISAFYHHSMGRKASF